jgi:dolichol-phosphate mannosyltransferase
MSNKNKILIVLPTYNEAGNIRNLIGEVMSLDKNSDVLVIDDNSIDGTSTIVKKIQKTNNAIHLMERPSKLGLGSAYILGFVWGIKKGYSSVIQMDADFSHKPSYIPTMLDTLKTCDVVIGSRYTHSGGVDSSWSLFRKLLSRFGNWYARSILHLHTRDVTAGFKCFKTSALQQIDLQRIVTDGYAFQIEVALACEKVGLSIKEIPIIFYDRISGVSKMSIPIIFEAFWKVPFLAIRYKKNRV